MIKEFSKKSSEKWEKFRVIKKFTIFPLRIYQYTSQITWWSWLSTTYILQSWEYSTNDDFMILSNIKVFFFGGYFRNSRISDKEEYEDYQKYKLNNIK